MTTVDVAAAEHLRRGREALVRKRQEIDDAIVAVDRAITLLDGPADAAPAAGAPGAVTEAVKTPTHERVVPPAPSARPTAREAILAILRSGERRSAREILDAAEEMGADANESTIRHRLAKLARDGVIDSSVRGHYKLIGADKGSASTDAEGPAVQAGPSVPDPSIKEGVSTNGTDPSGGHDETTLWQTAHRDHPVGAPVGG